MARDVEYKRDRDDRFFLKTLSEHIVKVVKSITTMMITRALINRLIRLRQ